MPRRMTASPEAISLACQRHERHGIRRSGPRPEHHAVGDVTSIVVLVMAAVMPLAVMVLVIARMAVAWPLRPAIIAVVPLVPFPLVARRTR